MNDDGVSARVTPVAATDSGEAMHSLFARFQQADERVFAHVAGWHSPVGDTVLPRLSLAASYSRLWIGISAVLGLTGGKNARRAVLEALTAVAISSAVVNIAAKSVANRKRPRTTVPDSRALEHPSSSSFPSGHSASAAAFSGVVGHRIPAIAIPINATAASVAFSRVYTGVHYPSDVAVGWAVGRIVARVLTLVSDRLPFGET
jgi:undecaprenyl-diphosphatase